MCFDDAAKKTFFRLAVAELKIPDKVAENCKDTDDIQLYSVGFAQGIAYAWDYFKSVYSDK
jgi:hypothetical protein